MSRLSILLVLTLQSATSPATPLDETFVCYAAVTEIGTAARRDYRDGSGFVVKSVYYASSEGAIRPSCADGTLRVQSTTTFERDRLGRVLVAREAAPDQLSRMWRFEYASSDLRPSKRINFGFGGQPESEIRYENGRQQAQIYFDGQGRVMGINGVIPDDLDFTVDWGPSADGWRSGLTLHTHGQLGTRERYFSLHLQNMSAAARFVEVGASLELALRNASGEVLLPRPEEATTVVQPTRVQLAPGATRFVTFDLRTRYGNLRPGRYSLQVQHPHPSMPRMLASNTLEFEVFAQ